MERTGQYSWPYDGRQPLHSSLAPPSARGQYRRELGYEILGYGELMELAPQHLVLVAFWIIWCFFHSLMITPKVTDRLKGKLGDRFRFYRLFFNTIAIATFCPLALYSLQIKEMPILIWKGAFVVVRYSLFLMSVFLFLAGARHYRLSAFLGLDPFRQKEPNQTLSTRPAFATSGILGVIRHPWYVGGLLLIWARDLGLTALIINWVLSLYLLTGAFLEERKLLKEFGEDYRHYRNRVSMLFPWKWLKRKWESASRHWN